MSKEVYEADEINRRINTKKMKDDKFKNNHRKRMNNELISGLFSISK